MNACNRSIRVRSDRWVRVDLNFVYGAHYTGTGWWLFTYANVHAINSSDLYACLGRWKTKLRQQSNGYWGAIANRITDVRRNEINRRVVFDVCKLLVVFVSPVEMWPAQGPLFTLWSFSNNDRNATNINAIILAQGVAILIGVFWKRESWRPNYPPNNYFWTVPLILDHSYLVAKLTSSKIADTKVSGF
jgi:hypothetical protein